MMFIDLLEKRKTPRVEKLDAEDLKALGSEIFNICAIVRLPDVEERKQVIAALPVLLEDPVVNKHEQDEIKTRILELTKKAMRNSFFPPKFFASGRSLVFSLACERDAEAVELIIDHEATLNSPIHPTLHKFHYPIYVASAAGCLEAVKVLVKRGAKVRGEFEDESWPMLGACMNGHFEVAQFLLQHNAKFQDVPLAPRYPQPLHFACFYDTPQAQDFIVELIQKGASVTVEMAMYDFEKNIFAHRNPLLIALYFGNFRIVRTLTSMCGTQVLPPVKWRRKLSNDHQLNTTPKIISIMMIIKMPLSQSIFEFKVSTAISAFDLYIFIKSRISTHVETDMIELHWGKEVIYPSDHTLHELGFAGPTDFIIAKILNSASPWIAGLLSKQPFTIEWTPQYHFLFPKVIRTSVISFLLVGKQLNWLLDRTTKHKIISYICFGWHNRIS